MVFMTNTNLEAARSFYEQEKEYAELITLLDTFFFYHQSHKKVPSESGAKSLQTATEELHNCFKKIRTRELFQQINFLNHGFDDI
jgi:hypothetical protein